MVEGFIDAESGRHGAHLGREVGAVEIGEPRRRHQRAGLAGAAAGIEDAGIRRQAQRHQPGHRVGRGHIAVGVDQVGVVILRPGGVELHQLVGRRVGIGDRDIHILAHAWRQPFAPLSLAIREAGLVARARCTLSLVSHHSVSPQNERGVPGRPLQNASSRMAPLERRPRTASLRPDRFRTRRLSPGPARQSAAAGLPRSPRR